MPKTIIVIPCYNEEKRLATEEFVEYIKAHPDILFLFVNDGSQDHTDSVLKAIQNKTGKLCVVLNLDINYGKAEAVREAFHYAANKYDYQYIGYFDADLATPLKEIDRLIQMMRDDYRLVMGSRILRMGSQIKRKFRRHLFGRIMATAASRILALPIYDTQCGAKLMTKDLSVVAMKEPFISSWLFDIELIARTILYLGYQESFNKIYELPLIKWENKGISKIRLGDIIKMPLYLLKIYWHYGHNIKESKKI